MSDDDFDSEEYTKQLFHEHSELISSDPILFRKRVVRHLKERTGWERTDALQEYERVLKFFKKENPEFVAPLFDAAAARKAEKTKKKDLQPDDECYSILEILQESIVGRCQSFLTEDEARDKFNKKCALWPNTMWVLIKGLGPNSGDKYKLEAGEIELQCYSKKEVEENA